MESVIPLDSHENSDSEHDWDDYSEECSERILSTTFSEKCWSQKIHPYLSTRMANTVYATHKRCLIDNTVKRKALTYIYCLSRRIESRRMNALEFAWGMQRGTLNLNTRFNVFCGKRYVPLSRYVQYKHALIVVSTKFKDFWESFKWFLLPEEHTIRRFYEAAINDKDFPDIEQGPYNYHFVPHPDMKTVAIHRQMVFFDEESEEELKPEHFMFSSYPFANLGTLTCHVHPRFVICHIGWIAARADNTFLFKYATAHPGLLEPIIMCLQICNKWTRLLDKTNPKHLSFLKNRINPNEVITEDCNKTGNERLKPHISQKHVKKYRTGVKRKRKCSNTYFVPTNKLRMLEEQISLENSDKRHNEGPIDNTVDELAQTRAHRCINGLNGQL